MFVAPLVVLYVGIVAVLVLVGGLLVTVGMIRVRARKSQGTMVALGVYALAPAFLMVVVPFVMSLW